MLHTRIIPTISASLVIFAVCVSCAEAKEVFTKPGWYQVQSSDEGSQLWAGPFADELKCTSTPTRDNPADMERDGALNAEYACAYFEINPAWNE